MPSLASRKTTNEETHNMNASDDSRDEPAAGAPHTAPLAMVPIAMITPSIAGCTAAPAHRRFHDVSKSAPAGTDETGDPLTGGLVSNCLSEPNELMPPSDQRKTAARSATDLL